MPQNSCQVNVGRLLEIRVDAGYRTPADVDQMIGWIKESFTKIPEHQKVVTAADWRHCEVMTPEAAARAQVMFAAANPRTERSALLMSEGSAIARMQFMRLVREDANPNRRVFTSATEMVQWLGEVLSPEETRRLEQMIALGHR